jgi:hypothetical protein
VWANEGLAQYFEDGIMVKGAMTLGMANARRTAAVQLAIKRRKAVDFDELLNMSDETWSKTLMQDADRGGLLYDQAWSICYFLIHAEDGKYRPAFETYLQHISDGLPPEVAFRKAFGSTDTTDFRKKWEQYVAKLEPDPLTLTVQRMEFIGQALQWLQAKGEAMPRSVDQLRQRLQRVNYKATRSTHGVKFEFDSKDESLYEYPAGKDHRFMFELAASTDRDLPPSVVAKKIKPTPTLYFTKDSDGQITQEIEYK